MEKQENIFDQFYQEFLLKIDPDSREKLKQLDRVIEPITSQLQEEGWMVTRNCLMKRFENGVDVCTIDRDSNGFHLAPASPVSLNLDQVNQEGNALLQRRKFSLLSLHLAFLLKDDLLFHKKYSVPNPEDEEKVEDIRNLLGFQYPTVLPEFEEEVRRLGVKLTEELSHYFRLSYYLDHWEILEDEYQEIRDILKHNPVARKLDDYRFYSISNRMDEDLYKQVYLAYYYACRNVQYGSSYQKEKTEN